MKDNVLHVKSIIIATLVLPILFSMSFGTRAHNFKDNKQTQCRFLHYNNAHSLKILRKVKKLKLKLHIQFLALESINHRQFQINTSITKTTN